MKHFLQLVSHFVIGICMCINGILLAPLLPGTRHWYQFAAVQSGSMEPALPVGSLVVYVPQDEYQVGDIICYRQTYSNHQHLIIHRIVDVHHQDQLKIYLTHGDAINSPEDDLVGENQVEGQVVLVIPYAGYLVQFCQSPRGIIIAVLCPLGVWWGYQLLKVIWTKFFS